MVAESHSVIGTVGGNVVLSFIIDSEANPPVLFQNITVTFNAAPILAEDRFSLQLNESVFTIAISSLVLADEGVYAVTVETIVGNDTAETMLELDGEENDSF